MVFDLGVLFWEILNPLGVKINKAPRSSSFGLLSHRCEIEIFWGKPCFARIKKDKRTIHLIDSYAYFSMGLGKALKMLGGELKKETKPKDLGERLIPLKELRPYLEADCIGALGLLKEIERLHEKYETRLCVSLPQLSSKIFRHYYVKKDFPIPTRPLLAGALLSYHGGKNSFTGKPGWHDNCYDLDINSAYPEAMLQLPDFERGRWVLGSGRSFLRSHIHGIYRISGTLKKCPWGCISTHDFKKAHGRIKDLWVTGYEIQEALRSKEITLRTVQGYGFRMGFRRNKRDKSPTAFARFVTDFYRLRSETKDPALKYFYKLILNSLYGKFIQRTPQEDEITGKEYKVAGSMFDPSIASLITGYVRAKIHRLEHKYMALHTATDGLITQKRPDPKDIGPEIGKLKYEWDYAGGGKGPAFGKVLILRNKLYLFFDRAGELKKSGLHGFQGKGEDLERIWKSSKRIYHINRLVKWSEAWHIGIPPGRQLKGIKRVLRLN